MWRPRRTLLGAISKREKKVHVTAAFLPNWLGRTTISLTADIHQNALAGDSFPPRSHENRRFFLHADKVWLFLLTAMTCIVFTTLAAVT